MLLLESDFLAGSSFPHICPIRLTFRKTPICIFVMKVFYDNGAKCHGKRSIFHLNADGNEGIFARCTDINPERRKEKGKGKKFQEVQRTNHAVLTGRKGEGT